MTLRELLAGAETQLRSGPHPERARLDTETLLLHSLRSGTEIRSRAWLLVHADDPAESDIQSVFELLIARRLAGEPIQYILGETEFFGLPFTVTPDVLIPRPETEHLVEEVIRLAQNFSRHASLEIADIGTGSGAIAVATAHALQQARITAIDISQSALAVVKRNAERNGVADRIEFLQGDLLEPAADRKFSIIASNPPYVPLKDRDSLAAEVRLHEPHTALFAGEDGLEVYRRLIPEARQHLHAGGWLVMEIGHGQREAIERLLHSHDYTGVHFVADYQQIPRVVLAQSMGAGS
jgi:release factor glutamine methyltransferase